jgi:hypothetical protein
LTEQLAYEVLPLFKYSPMDKKFIGALLDKLVVSRVEGDRTWVVRDRRHTVAWIACYVETETERLDDEFVNETKMYDVSVHLDLERKWLRFTFKLMTKGLEGSTSYYIEVRKTGEFYECAE